eukprot:7391456-Prymnesium_polylepis.1
MLASSQCKYSTATRPTPPVAACSRTRSDSAACTLPQLTRKRSDARLAFHPPGLQTAHASIRQPHTGSDSQTGTARGQG